ncbi:AAA family ATPase [Thalassotalea profundi]|uniref:ATPase AAA n=1 Tax=Thalassotalea profundi TaxID=2036687 RepID=A0ABQ3IQY3_9GAMM|nr:MoxR family ATPase [Thalassotalea profundi]GHE91083.1 ATPase AAA [Thalassotalea profundi]
MNELVSSVIHQIEQVVIGKKTQVKLAIACIFAKGHLLIEDLPGMGKTTLAHTLASTLNLSYQRVQFTSDLLPSDVIGVSIFDTQTQSFKLHKGPIFNQLVLADEINRASPKTQSALLEAMEESRVSIDGSTYQLPEPFFVIATQNPLFHSGTYSLPESQLDRFMMRLSLGFPSIEAEKKILTNAFGAIDFRTLKAFITPEQLIEIQKQVQHIYISDAVLDYVVALLQQSRGGEYDVNPLSPRAGKALISAAKAWAFIEGRDHLLPDDIQAVFVAVCQHRLNPVFDMSLSNINDASQRIINAVDAISPSLT